MSTLLSEKNIRFAFTLSLVLKGVFAVFEVIGGFGAYVLTLAGGFFAGTNSGQTLLSFVESIARQELSEDPRDLVAKYFLSAAQSVSVDTLHFTAFYLVSHGVIKVWLVVGLLRKRLWYYPVALVVFGLFIAYQLYRYTFTHSAFLILLTVVDLIVIGLTWHEYRYLRRRSL